MQDQNEGFQQIFELAAVGIAQAEPRTGRFLRVNSKYCEITGYTAAELARMSFRDVTHPLDLESDISQYRSVVEGSIPEYWSEKRYIRKDGAIIWVTVNAVVIRDQEGHPMSSVGVINDVTDRKRLEQQLAEMAERERRRLGRDLHDSLGQQITGIGMLAAALRAEVAKTPLESCQALLQKLEESIATAQTQIRGMLNGLMPVDVSGGGLAAGLKRLAEETTIVRGVACRLECQNYAPLKSNFVATQLFLIAREAVNNATKHSGASEIVIRLTRQHGVRVEVIDNGSGWNCRKTASPGMGMQIMKYRAGLVGAELHLGPAEERGFRVAVVLRADSKEGRRDDD